MTGMLLAMAVLTAVAAAWLSRPWWATRSGDTQRRRAANVAAYHQRLAELDSEIEAGLIEADAAERLRQELGARLLADAGADDGVAATGAAPRRRPLAAAVLGLLVAAFAAGWYYQQGSWKTDRLVALGAPAVTPDNHTAAVGQMLGQLEQRVQAQPQDAEAWAMLARAYFILERYGDSARAYARLNEITGGENPDALVDEGEALALSGNRDLRGRPRQLFDQALAIAPGHGKGLWYAGLAAEQAGDPQTARLHWSALMRQPELPQQLRSLLDTRLAQMGGPAAGTAPALATKPEAPAAAAAAGGARLRLSLRIAPELAPKIPPGAVLFVFAKAENGPPMPLAVHRGPAGTFPAEITLDDSMAMTPAMKLSQFDRWVVTARLSQSGEAKAQSGDLQGSRAVGRAEAGEVLPLVIDQVVP